MAERDHNEHRHFLRNALGSDLAGQRLGLDGHTHTGDIIQQDQQQQRQQQTGTGW